MNMVTVNRNMMTRRGLNSRRDSAKAQGAELLITACPLCLYNLSQNTDGALPVRYFTELLAEALGVGEDAE